MGADKEKDEMEGIETISPEQARKEMRQAIKRLHEEEGKHNKSSSRQSHTTSKHADKAQKDALENVKTISPEQAKQEMHQAIKDLHQEEKKK